MNARAPNSPDTGSQMSPSQKPKPNFSIDSIDCRHSSTPMPTTMRRRSAAKAPVATLNPRSALLNQLRMGESLRDLDALQGGLLALHDGGRQRRVAEGGGVLLAVGQRPL